MALSSSSAISPHIKNPTKEGSTGVKVKQESPDEAEIKELAAKMVEAHKSKLAASAASRNSHNNNVVQCGQTSIQNYLAKQTPNNNKDANLSKKPSENKEREPTIDEDSARGRFGWETFGKCYVPYIFRRGVKYVAVRMVEMKLLNKFLARVHPDLYTCTCIRSYFITEAEARLLNEINIRHSEGQFGKDSFTSKDSVVLLQDAVEFYKFLEVTYSKLLHHKNDPMDKCGFIRINGEAVVPFTVRDGEKYVPLFYFEGETDNLKLKAKQLEGWDLSYLKFCCKVQGIRNELFASDTCSVISLNDIKSYFPSSTLFQDYWPGKVMNPLLLDSVLSGTQQGAWTKQPGGAPTPVVKSTPSTVASSHQVTSKPLNDTQMKMLMPNSHLNVPMAHQHQIPTPTTVHSATRMNASQVPTSNSAVINGWSGLVGGQPTYQNSNQSMRLGSVPLPVLTTTATSANRQWQPVRMRTAQPYYGQVPMTVSATIPPSQPTLSSSTVSHPPPLVRGTVESSTMGYPTYGKDTWSTTTYSTTTTLPTMSHSSILVGDTRQQLPTLMAATNLMHATTTASSVSASRSLGRDPISSAKYPPPLIPAVNPHNPQVSQATPQTNIRYGYSTSAEVIDLSSPPRSPHRSQQQAQMQSQHHTQRLQTQTHQMQHTSQVHQLQQQRLQQQHQQNQQQLQQHQQSQQHQQQQQNQQHQQQQQNQQHQQNQLQQNQLQQNQLQQSQHQQNQHQQSQHQQNQHQQNQHQQNQQQLQQRQQTTQQQNQIQHQRQQQNQQRQQQQHIQQRQQELQHRVQQNNQSVRGGATSVHTGGGSNGDLSKQDTSNYKLVQIQETQVTGQHMPYKVSKAYVEGQLVPCINAKPYIYTELLMTLPDLTSHFFSNVSWHTLRQVLQEVLGVTLFRGNRLHMQVLRSSGKCRSTNEILPLVQVRDVMQYMPQLKYMLGRMNPEESLSKRQRTN